MDLESEIDALYRTPPADFTAARNALAARLRSEGRPAKARTVQALRKPVIAAWLVNRLLAEDPESVRRLVKLGEELRAAQRALLAGEGRERFDAARDEQRQVLQRLEDRARAILRGFGLPESPAQLERVSQSLYAAAVDPASARRVLEGRLTEPLRPPLFGGPAIALVYSAPEPARAERRARRREQPAPRRPDAQVRAKAREEERARRRQERERAAQRQKLERDLDRLQKRERSLTAQLARAEEEAQRTRQVLEELRQRLAQTRAALEELTR